MLETNGLRYQISSSEIAKWRGNVFEFSVSFIGKTLYEGRDRWTKNVESLRARSLVFSDSETKGSP